jgi:hypothetical protein
MWTQKLHLCPRAGIDVSRCRVRKDTHGHANFGLPNPKADHEMIEALRSEGL